MKIIDFIFHRSKKGSNSQSTSSEANKKAPDYSLRPNPDSYLDQNKESEVILQRIRNSSSSVLGIAGVRGTGKSSLALKVLSMSKESGYFTLLIHSPAGYEPREFLLSIFQRVCEATITKMEVLFGRETTLQARGESEAGKTRRTYRILVLGILIITSFSTIYSLYQFGKYVTQRNIVVEQDYIKHESLDLTRELSDAQRKKDQLIADLNTLESKLNLSPDEQQIIRTSNSRIEYLNEKIAADKVHLDDLQDRGKDLSSRTNAGNFFISFTMPLVIIAIIFYGGSIILIIKIQRLRRQYKLQKKFPKEVGLYSLAKSLLEHLKYQATITSSQDASVTLWKLATKFTRSKQLETRAISMPGLTADFNNFLNNVADVFEGKSIICLDELDKIIDPDQLEELLKGVKGILGQSRSHFLLTVSEDALARFSMRRRSERDILESSFDEIIYLNRVSFEVSKHIVSYMLGLSEGFSSPQFEKNCLQIWALSGGIPREIKRNIIACATENIDVTNDDPAKIWYVLFIALLDSLRSWALIVSGSKDISYKFLRSLENTQRKISADPITFPEAQSWYKELIEIWSINYQLNFATAEPNGELTEGGAAEDDSRPFERAIFELAIGSLLFLILCENKEEIEISITDKLLEVFMLLSYSPSYAGYKFHPILKSLGILSSPEAQYNAKKTIGNLVSLDK